MEGQSRNERQTVSNTKPKQRAVSDQKPKQEGVTQIALRPASVSKTGRLHSNFIAVRHSRKQARTLVDLKRIKFILRYIENMEDFIIDLSNAINKAHKAKHDDAIDKCLSRWEATAELLAIPGVQKNVWRSFRSLKRAGVVHE
jgi:hypothetical protein